MKNEHQKLGVHARITLQNFKKILLIQIVTLLVIAAFAALHSLVAAYSALCGGVIFLLPSYAYARRAWLKSGSQDTAGNAIRQLYASEIWKMAMTIGLFAAVFALIQPLNPFSLFGTYIGLQLVGFVVQLQLKNRFLKL